MERTARRPPRAARRLRQGLHDGQENACAEPPPATATHASRRGGWSRPPGLVDRRRFLLTSLAVAIAAPLVGEAQQAAKVPRIGFLSLNRAANPRLHEGFRQGLRELGYVDGRNLVIASRDGEGQSERLSTLAAELVALKVDVIVTGGGTPTALVAKQATRTTPIVFSTASEPAMAG